MKKNNTELNTYCENTWCPGCGNFGILQAFKRAIISLEKKGILRKNIVIVSGIGCNSKITDYFNLNSFTSLHGRPITSAQGIKLANTDLKVIVFSGDGGSYNEGISHLIHAAKRNNDITVLVSDNRNFALTTGQFTATSPKGFKGVSSPEGNVETPFNPLGLILSSNATFIARGYSFKIEHLKNLIIEGVKHKGFSFIEILQPCISFFNNYQFYQERVYELKGNDFTSFKKAQEKIEEWDYIDETKKIPIGIFYKIKKPTYEEAVLNRFNLSKKEKQVNLNKVLNDHL